MKKLYELVDISVNNENCVVFKVKDNAMMDLISLGCFTGTEDMIRMTKGRTPEITIFNKDGSNYSYHFGEGSTTIISDNMCQQREMIRECAILDYGIVCQWSYMSGNTDYDRLVKDTMKVKSVDDADRVVTLNSGGGVSCNIRINEQTMALHMHVKDVPGWFEARGYSVDFAGFDISKGLPCGNIYGLCVPIIDKTKKFTVSDISKERFSVLLNNAIKLIDEDYINCSNLYEVLSSELGMSDNEIKALGYGDCLNNDLDKVIANAQNRSSKSGLSSDGSGPNGGAGGEPDRVRDM